MRKGTLIIAAGGLAMVLALSGSGPLRAAEETPRPAGRPAETAQRGPLPFAYIPPVLGAPERRISGSTRGSPMEDLSITVLTPREVGHTKEAQPTLYWFASRPIPEPIEFTITAEHAIDPARVVPLRSNVQAGIHAISLAGLGVRLEPGRDYAWSIAVILDPRQRSLDLVTTGGVRRVEPPRDLAAQIAAAPPDRRPALYAQNGLWYDAFDTLSQLIAGHPQDQALRLSRSSLLEQVGLNEEAGFDLRH